MQLNTHLCPEFACPMRVAHSLIIRQVQYQAFFLEKDVASQIDLEFPMHCFAIQRLAYGLGPL